MVGVREVVGGDEVGLQGFGAEGQGFAVAGEEAVAGGEGCGLDPTLLAVGGERQPGMVGDGFNNELGYV